MKVQWTTKALTNLKDIKEYIAHDSPYYARLFASKITAYTRKLRQLPHLGRIVPELKQDDIRELIYQSYRIIYRVHESKKHVTILFILHGARDMDQALKDLPPS